MEAGNSITSAAKAAPANAVTTNMATAAVMLVMWYSPFVGLVLRYDADVGILSLNST